MTMTSRPSNRRFLFCLLLLLPLIVTAFPEKKLASAARTRDLSEPEFIGTTKCEKYKRECNEETNECTEKTDIEICPPPSTASGRNLCIAAWVNDTNGFQLITKGCWLNEKMCYGQRQCKQRDPVKDIYFCCCEGDNCNGNITFYYGVVNTNGEDEGVTSPLPPVHKQKGDQVMQAVLSSLVPIVGGAIIVVVVFFLWKRHVRSLYNGHEQLPTIEPGFVTTPSPSSLNLDKVELLELRARGRFGCVWKAQLTDHVAVKIFPLQDKRSWLAEQEIYNLPQMSHDNILKFIASGKRGENLNVELWLLTEFHDNGSLYDYLKGHVLTWAQMCKIAETMARGLAFLHDEIPATDLLSAKPAIAHRDFKSKNVLLKADLTACIADFGLALKFDPGKSPGETHGLVGTRRYMAPEVLEGAISFNREAFLRIDMYACGLVLWELMTRCSAADGPVGEYQLPFESIEEVGMHPSLEVMQEQVVTLKIRPPLHDHWKRHPGFAGLVCTVEECWDQDAEARLSAGCVQDRIASMARTQNTGVGTPVGSPNKPPLPLSSSSSPPLTSPPPRLGPQSPPPVFVPRSAPSSGDSVISYSTSSDIPPKDLSSC